MREYADPVIDWLDADGRGGMIATRLFRESCTYVNGSYVKDLRIVDPDLARVCLVDNSPISYAKDQCESRQTEDSARIRTFTPSVLASKWHTYRRLDQ